MRFALHILGAEVFAITTETTEDDDRGDVTTTPLGFVHTTPLMTDGRYGMDDKFQGGKA